MKLPGLLSICLVLVASVAISLPVDNEDKIKIPDALTPDEYEKVSKLTKNQVYIDKEIKDQLKKIGELHSSVNYLLNKDDINESGKNSTAKGNLIYDESTIDLMEAPVIFLEPPLILPRQQINSDKEVEKLLKSTGLETETEDKSSDPYKITSMSEVATTEKIIKSEIQKLRQDREILFRKMRSESMKIPDHPSSFSDFKMLKQELEEKDAKLKKEIIKLSQLEHVKEVLIKKHGPGKDVEDEEKKLEDREEEIGNDAEEDEF
ncbi:signal peptide containing protein [Theileria equi strain WA]|uniref:Signal peptide containing protein n=1 Tax=Theileria equi strain WA TaxID=1537102 RepID=L1LCC1_THEEQ|nr:signal peptide containing protein [Theileria equi strain WA]EKX72924.1 signal peptide containing protein [Theileria equi strain WA]|eukprot:XP_004832376.1 signal peptide containing protein [Theileria equi strain WA]